MKWHDKRVNIVDPPRGSLPWKPRKLGKPIDRGRVADKAESYPRLQFRYTKRWHLWSNELLCGDDDDDDDVTIARRETTTADVRFWQSPLYPRCLRNKVAEEITSLAFIGKLVRHLTFATAVLIIGTSTRKSITYRKVFPLCFRWSRDRMTREIIKRCRRCCERFM